MLGVGSDERWLEPCVGKGALLRALAEAGVGREHIRGIDIKPNEEESDRLAIVSRGVEFLEWSSSTAERFDKIIANPPYLAIERLQKRLRDASCRVRALGDIQVTAGGNSWFAFLCAAINLLRENGSLCFLLPAAYEYANYARSFRNKIGNYFERVSVCRSNKPLFADVQDGSVILVAQGFYSSTKQPPESRQIVTRATFKRADDLAPISTLGAQVNSADDVLSAPSITLSPETKYAKDLVRFGIGAVTGDANYFLMNDERRRALGLPASAFRPVLTRARQLTAYAITPAIWRSLREQGERVWLFYPSKSSLKHKAVVKYLRWGRSGGCERSNYKIAARSPWFRVLMPDLFDGFVSGMSAKGPFIAMRQMEGLMATNTLYGVNFLHYDDHEARCALALGLLTSHAHEQLARVRRNYADGLTKYELGDLRELRIIIAQRTSGASIAYRQATEALLEERSSEARGIADDWFQNSRK